MPRTYLNTLISCAIILHLIISSYSAPQRIQFKDLNQYSSNLSVVSTTETHSKTEESNPEIMIALYISNHAYSLPTFLATLEYLKCPNQNSKCHFWVIFDKCTDDSKDIFISWLSTTRPKFDKIVMIDTRNDAETRKKHPELSSDYFSSNLKKRAIKYGLDNKITHIFFLTADVVLTNEDTLNILLQKKKPVVAPLLKSFGSTYSTFWTFIDESNTQSEEYFDKIYNREVIGCFKVIGVHDCYLMDLTNSKIIKLLEADENDVSADVAFLKTARKNNLLIHVCNREEFGYIPSLDKSNKEDRIEEFIYMRMEHLLNGPNKTYNKPLPVTQFIDKNLIEKNPTKLGFDKIYIINLERRSDRRERIEAALNELNLEFKIFNAIDAKKIDENYINSLGIKSVPNYTDPYHDRPLNYGEISCFLSHYFIWKEMVENNYKKIIILEDDARFSLNFKRILLHLVKELSSKKIDWELLYLGRKIMRVKEESWVDKIKSIDDHGLLKPSFSHWTVAYALTLNGAKKLLAQEPLKKLVPVDEYLPIMFDKQPNEYWSSFFSPRDLLTYAIHPTIISPTHFFGEPGYISDTENTKIINKNLIELKLNENEQKQSDSNYPVINDEQKPAGDNLINKNQESFDRHIEL